jgi:GntR family transcriptional regulator
MWISINEQSSRPLYEQIVHQVKTQVQKGMLKPGDELPSVRELADGLKINMHTVRSAYLKLRDQGIINLHLGRKAIVAHPQNRTNSPETIADLRIRFEDIITDATLAGLSPEDIKNLVNQQLEQIKEET